MLKLSQATLKKEAQLAIRDGIKNMMEKLRKQSTMSEFRSEISSLEEWSLTRSGKADKLDCMLEVVRRLSQKYQSVSTHLFAIYSWMSMDKDPMLTVKDLEQLHDLLNVLSHVYSNDPPATIVEDAKSTSVPNDVVPEPTDAE